MTFSPHKRMDPAKICIRKIVCCFQSSVHDHPRKCDEIVARNVCARNVARNNFHGVHTLQFSLCTQYCVQCCIVWLALKAFQLFLDWSGISIDAIDFVCPYCNKLYG